MASLHRLGQSPIGIKMRLNQMIFSKEDLELIELMEKNKDQFKDLEESIMMNDSIIGSRLKKFAANNRESDGLLNF